MTNAPVEVYRPLSIQISLGDVGRDSRVVVPDDGEPSGRFARRRVWGLPATRARAPAFDSGLDVLAEAAA